MSYELRVESNIEEVIKEVEREIKRKQKEIERLNTEVIDHAYNTMVDEAPKRSGVLAGSIKVEETTNEATIRPTHPKAGVIETGTRPSPGRFVPALGKRIKTGRHPGTRPNPFVKRTLVKTSEFLRQKLEGEVSK